LFLGFPYFETHELHSNEKEAVRRPYNNEQRVAAIDRCVNWSFVKTAKFSYQGLQKSTGIVGKNVTLPCFTLQKPSPTW